MERECRRHFSLGEEDGKVDIGDDAKGLEPAKKEPK
jgi:hypothetical protein